MGPQTHINNYRFCILVCTVAKINGFKTIGPFIKFLKKSPDATVGIGYRAAYILKRVYKDIEDLSPFKQLTL